MNVEGVASPVDTDLSDRGAGDKSTKKTDTYVIAKVDLEMLQKETKPLTSKMLLRAFSPSNSPHGSPVLGRKDTGRPRANSRGRDRSNLHPPPPQASARQLSKQNEDQVAHRSILTISENESLSYVDDDEAGIDGLLQMMKSGGADAQNLRFVDVEHVRQVYGKLKDPSLRNDNWSPKLIALSSGFLDEEFENLVFPDGNVSPGKGRAKAAATAACIRRVREFFDDGFSAADKIEIAAVVKSVMVKKIKSQGGSQQSSPNAKRKEFPANDTDLSLTSAEPRKLKPTDSSDSIPKPATEVPKASDIFGGIDLFAVANKLNELLVEDDEEGFEEVDEHIRRRQSFERFYVDEHEPLAADHFDISVIHEELAAPTAPIAPATLPVVVGNDTYRPRTTSRVKEVPLFDDNYRPRTTSRVTDYESEDQSSSSSMSSQSQRSPLKSSIVDGKQTFETGGTNVSLTVTDAIDDSNYRRPRTTTSFRLPDPPVVVQEYRPRTSSNALDPDVSS